MKSEKYHFATVQEQPEWYSAGEVLIERSWPAFMLHDPVAGRYWDRLYQDFPEY